MRKWGWGFVKLFSDENMRASGQDPVTLRLDMDALFPAEGAFPEERPSQT